MRFALQLAHFIVDFLLQEVVEECSRRSNDPIPKIQRRVRSIAACPYLLAYNVNDRCVHSFDIGSSRFVTVTCGFGGILTIILSVQPRHSSSSLHVAGVMIRNASLLQFPHFRYSVSPNLLQ